jgi:hypothetical protein
VTYWRSRLQNGSVKKSTHSQPRDDFGACLKVVLHVNVTEGDFLSSNVDRYYVQTIDTTSKSWLPCMSNGRIQQNV